MHDAPVDARVLPEHCVLCGHRAADLAAGEADVIISRVCAMSVADFLIVMHPLSESHRSQLLENFNIAHAKLVLGLSIKYAEC